MPKIDTVILMVLLIGTVWLGGYTIYQINTTDIRGVVNQLVKH